jgi:hypothetical protein
MNNMAFNMEMVIYIMQMKIENEGWLQQEYSI